MEVCTTSAPGQQECDNALRQMRAMRPLVENPTEPVTEQSYFDSLDGVAQRARILAETMTGISAHARGGELHDFCDDVADFAGAVCGISECAAQAAYLVGIADANSTPGRPGLVDQAQFARSNQAIQNACSNLTNPAVTKQQVRVSYSLHTACILTLRFVSFDFSDFVLLSTQDRAAVSASC